MTFMTPIVASKSTTGIAGNDCRASVSSGKWTAVMYTIGAARNAAASGRPIRARATTPR